MLAEEIMKAMLRIGGLSVALALTLFTSPVQASGISCWVSCPEGPVVFWLTWYQPCCGVPHTCPSGGTGYATEYSGQGQDLNASAVSWSKILKFLLLRGAGPAGTRCRARAHLDGTDLHGANQPVFDCVDVLHQSI